MFRRPIPPALLATALLGAIAGCPATPAPQATPAAGESRRPSQPSRPPNVAPTRTGEPVALPGVDDVVPGTPRPVATGTGTPTAAGTPAQAIAIPCAEPGQVGTPPLAPRLPDRPNAVAVGPDGAVWIALDGRAGLWKAVPEAGPGCGWAATKVPGSESLSDPRDLAFDLEGRWLWIADHSNHAIARLDTQAADGRVERVAGGAGTYADGTFEQARFWNPAGVAVDQYGAVYVADSYNHRVRRMWNGKVTTLAGLGTSGGELGQFNYPLGIAVALPSPVPSGRPTPTPLPSGVEPGIPAVFVADTRNHRIVRLQLPPPSPGPFGTPSPGGQTNGSGSGGGGTSSIVVPPRGAPGYFTVIAGEAGQRGEADGPGHEARFSEPGALRFRRGTLWVTDTGNGMLRRIGSLGVLPPRVPGVTPDPAPTPGPTSSPVGTPRPAVVDTFAGGGRVNDGALREAGFRYPRSLAIAPTGEVWVADTDNMTLRVARPNATPTPEP